MFSVYLVKKKDSSLPVHPYVKYKFMFLTLSIPPSGQSYSRQVEGQYSLVLRKTSQSSQALSAIGHDQG